ncbi:hypothetical protein PFNF54_03289 [Plasmodium falciparum NF54]|uniref:Uncharacterized protein n=1 Tax=Plasmodium falciparum (isolate NF54) TaxID=5843 RepID=W7K3X4_PLAFO|nr:hypothetical protein PFNF54_03289 [Plasmodium falciparum NF54]
MNDHNQNISSYNNIFQSNNIPNNNELSNLISPQQKEENILSNQLKSHKQIDVTEIHIEDESTKGCLSMHSIKLKKNKNKIRTKLYLFDMIPKSNIYKKMYMDIILMNFNHLGLKKIGCFLFENSTLPTINTFIILDIILRILKIRGNKKKREKTKKNYKKKKLKRALLLTNKTLIDLFPPDFDFILNFLNNSLDRKDKDNDKDNDNNNDNHIDNNNDNNNENIWTVNKIKNYKNLYRNFKDDKKYNIKNNNQNEEKNSLYINNNHICDDIYNQHIYNLKNEKQTNDTFDNLHITIEMLKDILNFIHIKYIDKENYLINLLYKLNQNKKYNIIVINISFFFIKDDKKIKIFLDYILSSAYKNVTKELTMKNKDKNNYDHKNEFLSNSNNIIYSNIEAEMCDRPFYKNILNIYFHYSYFINFFEYLNSVSHLSLTSQISLNTSTVCLIFP